LLVLLILSGCGHGRPSRWNLHPQVERPQPGVVLFIVDGLPPRFVEQGCREGWMPNVRRYFCDGGLRVERATTTLPAITYAAMATLLTGVGPGTHGVVGNRWFEPRRRLFRDYATIEHYRDVNSDFDIPTIYERLRPATSISIQAAHRRGATKNIANWALSGTMWFFGDYTAVDKLTASSLWRVTRWANRQRRWPTILTLYFPGLDSVGHRYGPDSQRFRWAVWHADWQIGRICAWLERQGLLETTYLVLVSDHGMVAVRPDGHIDLLKLLRDGWGRRATDRMLQNEPSAGRAAYYDQFDTVVTHQDGRAAALHFRGPNDWDTPPDPAAVERILTDAPADLHLWNIPGVELVAYLRGADEVVLRSAIGEARILTRPGADGPEYAYEPTSGDVLGYMDDAELAAFVSAGFHSSREWLEATADQRLPDVVPHLPGLLGTPRAGQVVLFAQPGYSFAPEAGGHGGLDRDERLMTFLIAGPGIVPARTVRAARAVDLVPTLLDLLNVECDEEWLEGESLLRTIGAAALDAPH